MRIETFVTKSYQWVPIEPTPVCVHVGPERLSGHPPGVGLQDGVKLEPEEEAETVSHQPTRGAVTGRGVVTHRAQTRRVHHVESENKVQGLRVMMLPSCLPVQGQCSIGSVRFAHEKKPE